MKKNNIISDWLDQYGDHETEKFVSKNLAITEKVRLALEKKGWTKGQLAQVMGKSPSEVSKWLSGMHNLTLKSIVKMEVALDIDLIHCEPVKEYEYVYLGVISNTEKLQKKKEDYIESGEMHEYPLAM